MNTYDYSILNDKEFEELCRDLISIDLDLSLQTFKTGKDGGIDLRYSSTKEDNEIIVQVKQYAKSGFSALKAELKKNELPKVKRLSPKRYIIATSVELSPKQVEELKEIFTGYIHTLQDIYHKNILDRMLATNPTIERKYYKLWLTSSNILTTIVHKGSFGMANLLEKDIKNNIQKFVISSSHTTAFKKLLKEKILIITGKPGVGKTTLAKILVYKLLSEKNCQLIEINDSINDANNLIDYEGESNQVIYFDDFLGSNLYEIFNPKNSEGLIHRFIQRIKTVPGKYLIITSRTTIINKARSYFEIYNSSQFHEKNRFVIEIDNYSRAEKARILYNHVVFSPDNPYHKNFIKQGKFFLKIIDHKNYSPRLIEFITGPHYSDIKSSEEYQKKVLYNLEFPETIWKASYEIHLDNYERWILQILMSIKNEGSYELVEKLYTERLVFESRSGITVSSESTFKKAILNLSGSYLNLSRNSASNSILLRLSNPSIADFLRDYISNDFSILKRMILSSKDINQLNNLMDIFKSSYLRNYKYSISELQDHFASNERLFCNNYSHKGIIDYAYTYYLYFPNEDRNELMTRLLSKEVLLSKESFQFYRFLTLLSSINSDSDVGNLIKLNWDDLILKLYDMAEDENDYGYIVDFFASYDKNFDEWLNVSENLDNVNIAIGDFLAETLRDELLNDIFQYKYDQFEEGYFSPQYGYGTDYTYELNTDINEVAGELLDSLLSSMQMQYFVTIDEVSLDLDEIKDILITQYRQHMETYEYEKDYSTGEGYQSFSNDSDHAIENLFD